MNIQKTNIIKTQYFIKRSPDMDFSKNEDKNIFKIDIPENVKIGDLINIFCGKDFYMRGELKEKKENMCIILCNGKEWIIQNNYEFKYYIRKG